MSHVSTLWRALLGALLILALGCSSAVFALGEGSDVEVGGVGTGNGLFSDIRDITCDAQGNVYVLDWGSWTGAGNERHQTGNALVQKFDNTGKFLSQFSIADNRLGNKFAPDRIAVDSQGNIYVTHHMAGYVVVYAADGTFLGGVPIPWAYAITTRMLEGKEQVLVVCNGWDGKVHGGDLVYVLDVGGKYNTTIKLDPPVTNVADIACDAQGNIYLVADINEIHKYDPAGKRLQSLGAQTKNRAGDGSELIHTVALDSKGTIYAMGYGNPAPLVKISADLTTIQTREGQFKWADPWSIHSGYTPLAIDKNDRIWVAATGPHDPNNPNFKVYRPRPCVVRTEAAFFDKVPVRSMLTLGLTIKATVGLPYSISYDVKQPIPVTFAVTPAIRYLDNLTVKYRVYDMYKNEAAHGQFDLALVNGQPAQQTISFTPPKWGWYTVCFEAFSKDLLLDTTSQHVGVTPKYPGMPTLEANDSNGGWEDPARQAFCGLQLMRVHPNPDNLKGIEDAVNGCRKYGVTLVAQFQDKANCNPEFVAKVATQFKGRIKYYEVINEPNFSVSPKDYVGIIRQVYTTIKAIDPQAKIMGPDVCGIQIGWYEDFFKNGGNPYIDILSEHDYEGHESIDPVHWVWKYGELRKLMAKYGAGNKEVWQTERAITGVRGGNFLGSSQAVRVLLHRDLLETLGVPGEHNSHYYLNEGGYSAVPSYLWSSTGPHPGAIALRTRQAMIVGRKYSGKLDFGPTGNKLFQGLRYVGADGSTITLRNYGVNDQTLDVTVTGAKSLNVYDAFGNKTVVPVENGKAKLTITQMPIYLRLNPGQSVTVPKLDFGRNIAGQADYTYSATSKGTKAFITNKIFEVFHAGNPNGDIGNPAVFVGDAAILPQTFDITFAQPREVNKIVLYSLRADNAYCALLDYDLQYRKDGQWVTLRQMRAACPPTNRVKSSLCIADTWYLDDNISVCEFDAVTTDALRVVVLRTTFGFGADADAAAAIKETWGGDARAQLMLREVEIYGPPAPIAIDASLPASTVNAAFTKSTMTLTVSNRTAKAAKVTAAVTVPAGWKAEPATTIVQLAANGTQKASVSLIPPVVIPTGDVPFDLTLTDAAGKVLDRNRVSLTITSPVTVTPQGVAATNAQGTQLLISVKNTSTQPASGKVAVTVTGTTANGPVTLGPVEATLNPVAAGATASVTLTVPGMTLSDATWTATYAVTANKLTTTSAQVLSVRPWMVLGSFPNDFAKEYGPEQGVDFAKSYKQPDGMDLAWKPAFSAADGLVNFLTLLNPNQNVCAYAAVYVKCPTARKATLATGSDDGIRAWINGKDVLRNDTSRGAAPGQDKTQVDLQEGWNTILVKITQGGGGWGFYADLLTPDGKPMSDLLYTTAK